MFAGCLSRRAPCFRIVGWAQSTTNSTAVIFQDSCLPNGWAAHTLPPQCNDRFDVQCICAVQWVGSDSSAATLAPAFGAQYVLVDMKLRSGTNDFG